MTDHDRQPGEPIATTESAEEPEGGAESSAARRFDIRRIIGGLFVVFGAALLIAGVVDGDAAARKSAGIDINLWTGGAMLLLGVGFLVWMRLNPVQAPEPAGEDDRPPAH
jgi:hypothetical protein